MPAWLILQVPDSSIDPGISSSSTLGAELALMLFFLQESRVHIVSFNSQQLCWEMTSEPLILESWKLNGSPDPSPFCLLLLQWVFHKLLPYYDGGIPCHCLPVTWSVYSASASSLGRIMGEGHPAVCPSQSLTEIHNQNRSFYLCNWGVAFFFSHSLSLPSYLRTESPFLVIHNFSFGLRTYRCCSFSCF